MCDSWRLSVILFFYFEITSNNPGALRCLSGVLQRALRIVQITSDLQVHPEF